MMGDKVAVMIKKSGIFKNSQGKEEVGSLNYRQEKESL
jgi:hypothetical protein